MGASTGASAPVGNGDFPTGFRFLVPLGSRAAPGIYLDFPLGSQRGAVFYHGGGDQALGAGILPGAGSDRRFSPVELIFTGGFV